MSAFDGRFLLGVNYWSRAGATRMWERFDAEVVRRELTQLRAIGLDCARMFARVPAFMPTPPSLAPDMLERFSGFAKIAEEVGVGLLPTPLVGHMSGENYDFPGQGARSLYADPELRAWQRALVAGLADALRDLPAVLGWVLSNEMPLWAGAGAPADVEAWAQELIGAVRGKSDRPVGIGDGAMAIFPTRTIAPHVDWLAPHVYYGDSDPLRQAWQTDLSIRSLQPLGRPVLLEEFGCSTTQAGEREQAAYWREAVACALGTGARGAVGWCFTDFDPETIGRETPYSHHAFELGFGVTRADGSEKPVCDELRAYRRVLDGLPLHRVRAVKPRCAIVRSHYLDEDYPFSWQDREALRKTQLQAFVLASQAGLDPMVVGEGDDLSPYSLILCPATQKLLTPTWLALAEAARAGATVYWSYLSGDHSFHQGAWCPIFETLTGLSHRLRYGCFELPPERVTLKGPFNLSVPTGIHHSPNPHPLSRLPVEQRKDAKVRTLALDGEGRPALFAHDLGRGQVLFLTYPFERYLANLPDGSSRDAHRLYRLLADEAGLDERYPTHHPDVQSRVLEDGPDDLVLVQHRGWTDAVDDATDVPRDAEVLLDLGGRPDALAPKAVRLYRVANVRT